jgi:hypothetical protein
MINLPYFLLLIKKDVILWTIITTGNFTDIKLDDIDHDYWTSQYLQIMDYSLNDDEKFDEIWITNTDILTTVSFRSSSSKYLDNTKYYFDDDIIMNESEPYYIADTAVIDSNKKLDPFDVGLDMPINITVGYSSCYGYYVDIVIYRKGWIDKVKNLGNVSD